MRCASLATLFALVVSSALAEEGEWRLQDPIVISSEQPPKEAGSFLWMAPIGVCASGQGPVVGCLRGIKVKPALDLWLEQPNRSWRKLATIDHTNFPGLCALGGDVGVVSSMGKDASGGYGNSLEFFRVRPDGHITGPVRVAAPDGGRLTLGSVHASGETISCFLLEEGHENRLLLARSDDGGATWKKPSEMGKTTMKEDNSHIQGLQWSAEHLGRFVFERDGKLCFWRTRDAGKTWATEPVAFADDLGPKAKRMALGAAQTEGVDSIVYVGFSPDARDRGRYFLTRSTDQGKTWATGVALTDTLPLDDPSMFVQIAGAGKRVAFSFIEVKGKWTKGEMAVRLLLSQDAGVTWKDVPIEQSYAGVAIFGSLWADPKGDRILFSTSICTDIEADTRNYLTVQEFSARPSPSSQAISAEDRKLLEELIRKLGASDFETREEASRRLAAFGRRAKDALLEATKSQDAEVAARAQEVLSALFPACLRIGGSTPERK